MNATGEFEAKYVRPRGGRTLIVGSRVYKMREDRRAAFVDSLGVDMLPGPGVDLVHDLEEPLPDSVGNFRHAECISVLEHCRRPWLVAESVTRALVTGGSLHLSAPLIWRPHGYPSDYFRFTAEGVRILFPGIVWHALMYASTRLQAGGKLPGIKVKDFPYFARTEVLGFGLKA